MSASSENSSIDQGFIGYSVRIHYSEPDFGVSFPVVTLGDLARELAEMLRDALPNDTVTINRHGCFSGERPEAEHITDRIKRRVIEARETARPGIAFLRGIGCWGNSPVEHLQAETRA
ncbi:hypothetical protein [Pseudomonas paeninsulae]|uniref:hypothetical protein n=1 Tax=Pseudomonas paeninsulae TaxID=3110772 RepID=UPI002D797BEC|nr:hypothetical protein [Pseudomonas sp. IT1137]